MAKQDILQSLEYRRIKDTYHSVIFTDNKNQLYNGDGIILPFCFSTNAITLSGHQITCDGILSNIKQGNITNVANIITNKLFVDTLALSSNINITDQKAYVDKSIIPNSEVRPEFTPHYEKAVDAFNEISSDFEPALCNHFNDLQSTVNFTISDTTHYVIIIATVILNVYENRGDINLVLNKHTIQSKWFEMSVTGGYSGGGKVPVTFIYTIAPNSTTLLNYNNNNILELTSNLSHNFNMSFSDILILHGVSI